MSDSAFRGQRPRVLSFGTSGLRGLVSDLTDLEVWINTKGFLAFLAAQGELAPATKIAVAGDLRPSTQRILAVVCHAVRADGGEVIDCGRIPTPALCAYAFHHRIPSIMVTGSHIPFDRNGIKFNLPSGEVLKHHEAPILAHVARIREETYLESPEVSLFDDTGYFRDETELSSLMVSENSDARDFFFRRNVDFFGPNALQGLRVAVYQHSAVGRDVLVDILQAVGAQTHPVGRSETFVPIDTEAVDDALLERLRVLAIEARDAMGRLDGLVSTDGDSDRPLLVVFDDETNPIFVRGDTLGVLVAEDLQVDALAIPVSVSDLVDRQLGHLGVAIERTRIGSPWVIEGMSAMDGSAKVGFEANGGFLIETRFEHDGRILEALPTRDAFVPLLSVLKSVREAGKPLWHRLEKLPQRATTAGLIDAVPRAQARAALDTLACSGVIEMWVGAHPRVRAPEEHPRSATGEIQERIDDLRNRIESMFSSLNLGPLDYVNWVDGTRMRFSSGDIIHLRPSGNAPQFRVYVTSDSMAQAKSLVSACLGVNGVVTRMLADAQIPANPVKA